MSTMDWKQVGRNDPCPCGSGKKYKHCHMQIDREAAQQAEIEAAQRAEEERLAELIERTKARKLAQSTLALSDGFDDEADEDDVDPNIEYLDRMWELFEQAEGDRKWEICEAVINDQLMDSELVFEFFITLHRDALERGLESRFVQLVLRLREQCLDAYQKQVAYLFEWTFPFLSPSERETFLPNLAADLIADGPRKSEAFLNVVDMLAAFGESALYAQVVGATQEAIKMAGLFEWAVDRYETQLMDIYLFEYLDNTPPELRTEPAHINEWIETLPFQDELLKDA
ncbi:MAG: SEC-C domain-containing protein [Caldilineaceae bacterium]|nr:SEC-C domain-containing protein [Caldilineaceae bacterium]